MKYLKLVVFVPPLLLGCLGVAYTWDKIDAMKRIRGFKPGATVENQRVRELWYQPPNTYWVSWTGESIKVPGNHRLNLPESIWNNYSVGDEIEIVFLDSDLRPYHRDGIYASDGNFVFDYGILVVEIAMIVFALVGAPVLWWMSNKLESNKCRNQHLVH